jgi:signal transduction histidine kinase
VTNLITNAIKYAAGTAISIDIARTATGGRIRVRDRGPGIALENQARVFDRFERAVSHHNISGLGLGLYISRQIVDAHGGHIGVWSEPGEGSTFIVELPRDPAGIH